MKMKTLEKDWPSLMGPDKLKLLKQLPNKMVGCQPPDMVAPTQKLWKVWYIISAILEYIHSIQL